jgi:ankyrin repeat protein
MPKSKQVDAQLADARKAVDFITAIQAGNTDAVKQYLADGMSPDTPDAMDKLEPNDPSFNRRANRSNRCVGLSALSSAACLGQTEVCKILLDAGANANIQEPKEAMQTPLMIAIKNGQLSVMHLLLERGADCLLSDVVGNTAMKLTGYLKDPTAAKKALEEKLNEQKDRMTITQAVIHGDTPQVEKLLSAGHSPNEFHTDGFSCLFYACLVGRAEVLELLLEAGADINVGANGKQKKATVLSFKGDDLAHITAEEFFAKKAGKTIYKDRLLFGEAPIFAACELGRKDIVSRMLKAGCDVNAVTKVGKVSLLMLAVVSQDLELIEFLIDSGADLTHRDSRNASVLEWASKAYHTPDNNAVKNLIREKLGLKNAVVDFKDAFKKFKDVEATPEFKSAMEYMTDICQSKPYPWKKKKGVYRFYTNLKAWDNIGQKLGKGTDYLKNAKKEEKESRKTELADLLQDEIGKRGFTLVSHKDEEGSAMQLLFPTKDKYAVIAACGTDGMNYGHGNGEIIQMLTEMEEKQPFQISDCMHNSVGGRFTTPVKAPLELAEFLYGFCPDLADGELVCDEQDIARYLKDEQRFYLWWG